MAADEQVNVEIPLDKPTSARAYGWLLGGKDNFAVDRELALGTLQILPEIMDIARGNRLFLYRAVRYLVEEAGIEQFIDMGCGLPTNNNVHQVAQRFNPNARVVYVDIDPIVLAHGRALLADNANTTVITADFRDQQAVLDHPDTKRLIDFSKPVAVLYLSVAQFLRDDQSGGSVRYAIRHIIDEKAVSGSYLAFSHVVLDDPEKNAKLTKKVNDDGIPLQLRSREEVHELLEGLEPVDPGLVDIEEWRPDPNQPPLDPVPEELRPFEGVARMNNVLYEYGGVLRKP